MNNKDLDNLIKLYPEDKQEILKNQINYLFDLLLKYNHKYCDDMEFRNIMDELLKQILMGKFV